MSATLRGLGLCVDDLSATWGTSSAPSIVPGTKVLADDGEYKFIYNVGSMTITQYYPACEYGSSTTGYCCAGDNSTVLTYDMAGVAMTDIASANYGFVKCYGRVTARVSTTATAGYACACVGSYLLADAASTAQQVGVVIYGTTAAGTCIVKLNI